MNGNNKHKREMVNDIRRHVRIFSMLCLFALVGIAGAGCTGSAKSQPSNRL